MLVIQIDHVHAQALQAGFARGSNIFRLATDAAQIRIGFVADDSEFGGEKNFVATVADGFADKDFVVAVAVDVGGIQEIDTKFDGAVNRGDGFGVVRVDRKIRTCPCSQAPWGEAVVRSCPVVADSFLTSRIVYADMMCG